MATLETLEGDGPEILDAEAGAALPSHRKWEPDLADIIDKKRLVSGIPMRHRIAATGKATGTARRPARRIAQTGGAGARQWKGSAGRFVMVGEDIDPENLEGWLTDLKKGASKVAGAVSSGVRAVGSVQMDIVRSVAPVAGTVLGKAAAAYTGNPTALSDTGTGGTGILSSLSSMFSSPTPAAAPATVQTYTPAQVAPASSGIGGIPVLYLAGGALLLVILIAKR